MTTGTVQLCAAVAALVWACDVEAQPRASRTLPVEHNDVVTPSEPAVIWRNDGQELPRNTFGKYRNAFSADGRFIGVVRQPSEAWLLNVADGSLFFRLPYAPSPGAYSIAFSSMGEFAIGRQDSLEVFDARGESLRLIACDKCDVIGAVSFSSDGSLLAFQEARGPAFRGDPHTPVLDTNSYRYLRTFRAVSNRPLVAFAPDGQHLLTSSFSLVNGRSSLGFVIWNLSDGTTSLHYRGEPDANLGVVTTGRVDGHQFVAVYGKKDALEMRDLSTDRVVWTAPLIPPLLAPPETGGVRSEFDRGAIAPNGRFVITYESPIAKDPSGHVSGGIVIRSALDGRIMEVYAVYAVTGLSIAPDSKTFVYSTGAGQVHTALVRVPNDGML